jgi:hypothetical protein
MTDTMTSQNIDLSSWDTLYIYTTCVLHERFLKTKAYHNYNNQSDCYA